MAWAWYPRYPGDYKRDTSHLSLAEHGAYALLMDYYYSKGPIPVNGGSTQGSFDTSHDDRVMRICSAFDQSEKRAVADVLDQFFTIKDGNYHNKRADAILEKRGIISETKKKAVAAREEKRRKKGTKKKSHDTSHDTSHDDTTTTTTTNVSKDSVTLEELSVSHIEGWLSKQRTNGRYLTIDEHELLDVFKDYCKANGRDKGKKAYKDFAAAYRGSFKWDRAPRKGEENAKTSGSRPAGNKADRVRDSLYGDDDIIDVTPSD